MEKTPISSGLLIIFGVTGDLSRRYLMPALYQLCKNNLLPEHFEVIGVTRRGTTVPDILARIKDGLSSRGESVDEAAIEKLGRSIRVVKMDMTRIEDYRALRKNLDEIEDEQGICLNRLFYLSIPPQIFGPVVDFLGETGLNSGCQHGSADSRLMVEKPFGYDLASATELIQRLTRSFQERQIFRIDHYLAKETAQNILTFRFANPIFKRIWDRQSVTGISITASESIGIEGRAAFYESVGALRDFVQNHLLQLLSIIAMDQPDSRSADDIHAGKLELMKQIKTVEPDQVAKSAIRGQYAGYPQEVGNPDSRTETFARVELEIDNDRWRGVPIILQTGKHLDRRSTEIALSFQDAGDQAGNTLLFRLQPNEGIGIDVVAKKPGFELATQRVSMDFSFDHPDGQEIHPNAYERVLMDGIRGDQTLFASSAEVLQSWRVVNHIVRSWSASGDGLLTYQAGSTPDEVVRLAQGQK